MAQRPDNIAEERRNGYRVRFCGVSKRFGAVTANSDVSFEVVPGQVHALLGENGAGKTTLMNILAGMMQPDEGHIELDGVPRKFKKALHARRAGIGMVHQHFSLIPSLSVEENIAMEDSSLGPIFDRAKYCRELVKRSKEFGVDVDPSQPVWQLGHAQRQWLEIFRALYIGSHTLIFDEPTSALSPLEGDRLLERIRALSREGKTVLLITHKMREILTFADRVTVLNRGRVIDSLDVKNANSDCLTELMVGKQHGKVIRSRGGNDCRDASDVVALSVKNLTCHGSKNQVVLNDLSFDLRAGRILGVAGIAGNGQEDLAEALAGMRDPDRGTIHLNGHHRTYSPRGMQRYVPADRLGVGAVGGMSVEENLTLRDFLHPPITKRFFLLDRSELSRIALGRLTQFHVRYESAGGALTHLSGGNIQRVILARELSGEYSILVAHNPTAGLDIAGSDFVHRALIDATGTGAAVVLISSDMDELLDLSDDILVLHAGAVVGIFAATELDRQRLGGLMLGQKA